MRRYNQFLIKSALLLWTGIAQASNPHPYFVFTDVLYWKATEQIDWVYDNSLYPLDQEITYRKSVFDTGPGFRVGAGYQKDWDTGIYYTKYTTQATDSATGNLKTGFLAGTIGYPQNDIFYDAGQFKMDIDFNMFDWYLGKRFKVLPTLMLHPYLGVEGGWINQSIQADFQGFYITTEKLKNNFWGAGPKFGIDGALSLLKQSNYSFDFIAGFSSAYLFGHWEITDIYTDNVPREIEVGVKDRNMGAVVMQGSMGISFTYQEFFMALSYEINDWFDQGQIFDDATGGHDNDLIFQGLALRLRWNFDAR